MPNGNLNLIRNSDGKVIASGLKTVKSAKIAATKSLIKDITDNNKKGTETETYSICVPKESFSVSIDCSTVSKTDDLDKQAEKFSKVDFVS